MTDRKSRAITARTSLAAVTFAAIAPALVACQLAYMFAPDATETIQPEYSIGKRSVAVIIWADQSVIDEYPRARKQISRSMAHHLKEGLPDARIVSSRKVIELQEDSGLDWRQMTTNELCKELDCDFVLRVDLETFTTRASNTPHLRKARIDASLNLYKKADVETIESVYQDEVRTLYPPGSKHGAYDMDERDLMHSSIEAFSIAAARKFYTYEILLEDKRD